MATLVRRWPWPAPAERPRYCLCAAPVRCRRQTAALPCAQGIVWSIWKRLRLVMFPAGAAWLLALAVLHSGCACLRWCRPRTYARVRRPAALAFRIYGGGVGAGFLLLRLFFDAVDESTAATPPSYLPTGMARHAALLLMASSVVPLLLWAAAPLRLRYVSMEWRRRRSSAQGLFQPAGRGLRTDGLPAPPSSPPPAAGQRRYSWRAPRKPCCSTSTSARRPRCRTRAQARSRSESSPWRREPTTAGCPAHPRRCRRPSHSAQPC